jgi:iron complex transport system substrate-binding protein
MTVRIRLVVLLLVLVAAACAGNTSTTTTTTRSGTAVDGVYEGADGVESDIGDTTRIVSLNGDLTEIVFALGAGGNVVGIDLTTTYPPEATSLPAVGLGRALDAEAVIALEPTLVVGDTQIEPAAAIEQIRSAGIPVVILRAEVTLEGAVRKILTMGTILDLGTEAASLAAGVKQEIDDAIALASNATAQPRVAYTYVRGPETLLLFGNGMPTHFLIEAAGGVDAAAEAGVFFAEDLSAERLVVAAPDVLIVPIQGFEILGGTDAYLALPGVGDTPAGRAGSILTYDEALFLGMGPRVGAALHQLVLDLHPGIDS